MNAAADTTAGRGARLDELVDTAGAPPVVVTGLASDSRAVAPGDLFLACRGRERDARAFIAAAESAGAAAVVAEAGVDARDRPARIPLLELEQLGSRIGAIASRFFGAPSEAVAAVGVTGTNGKTTVSQLVGQLLRGAGRPCGVIGTLGAVLDERPVAASHTTPDAIALQRQLAAWRDGGVRHAALEVSSHALDQGRVNDLRFRTAVFTNLSREHLDYHGSIRAYGEAKLTLFRQPGLEHAVINCDDPFAAAVAGALATGTRALTVSTDPGSGADVIVEAAPGADGIAGRLRTPWGEGAFTAPLLGAFNAGNIAAAAAAVLTLGLPFDTVLAGIAGLRPVPGRMELLGGDGLPRVVIDYAHTPDALDKAIAALRSHARGRLFTVFGCGGDRDRGKRAPMGAIACAGSDRVFVTSDNPRGEDPEAIIAEIAGGCSGEFRVVVDRAEAIAAAIAEASADDVVLIAGKGHEDYQLIGAERLPFSDREVARRALERAS